MANDAFTAGQTLTAAEMNLLPFGYINRAHATATQSSIGTSPTDLTSLSASFTALASRRYRIEGEIKIRKLTSNGIIYLEIVRGSTVIQTSYESFATNDYGMLYASIDEVPGAGSVTYKLRAWTSGDTFEVNPSTGATTNISLLRIIDIGQ